MSDATGGRLLVFRIVTPLVALLPLLAFELVLRLIGYDPFAGLFTDRDRKREGVLRVSSLEDVEYELVPNARGYFWNASVAINSHGFRDREYPVEKPANVLRLVALGDSKW